MLIKLEKNSPLDATILSIRDIQYSIATFLIVIMLLCVYPTRIYRYPSQAISARKRLAIMAFAEVLHKCFKDGLNGTRDYRVLAGVYILAPIEISAISHIVTPISGFNQKLVDTFIPLFLFLIISYTRPCKSKIANLSLSYHFLMSGIVGFLFYLWQYSLTFDTVISHMLVLIWAGYKFFHLIQHI